ncbi:MAG: hypothetical protein Fur0044_12830 [Anaerolineae bacterium]
MKTDFLTLWVDDNVPFAQSIEANLKDWLDEKGFELKVSIHKDETGVLEEIKNKDIELIIIDYKLPGEDGDVLIEKIRGNGCYQDIIFYSGGPLPEKRLDGVFFVSKGDARTRIKELIELKLRRSSDFATLRGWIVADAIELEMMLDEILLKCFNPRHELFELQIVKRAGILDFFKKQAIINSILTDELNRLGQIKDASERYQKLQECKEVFKSFEREVIHYRNAVAHGRVEKTPDGLKRVKTLVKNPEYFDFDENNLAQGRKNLRKQRDCLVMLRQFIVAADE